MTEREKEAAHISACSKDLFGARSRGPMQFSLLLEGMVTLRRGSPGGSPVL